MAMSNVDLKEKLKQYRALKKAHTEAEKALGPLKSDILDEMEVRGIKEVQGEKSKSKTMLVDEYAAVVTSYDREGVSLDELVKEFGRDLLEAKKLLNSYPVASLKVSLTKTKG